MWFLGPSSRTVRIFSALQRQIVVYGTPTVGTVVPDGPYNAYCNDRINYNLSVDPNLLQKLLQPQLFLHLVLRWDFGCAIMRDSL